MRNRACVLLALALLIGADAAAWGEPPPPGPPRRPFHRIFWALDRDRDGQISAKELSRHAVEALKQLDANKDGRLTRDEIHPHPRRPPPRHRGRAAAIPPRARDKAEQRILKLLDTMARNESAGMMNVPAEDGRLLRLLAEAIGAKHVVEIGTSNGYSGIWLCLALMRTGGALTTYEIDRHRAALARKNFQRAGVDGRVTLVVGDAHREAKKIKRTIDLLFLDADKEGYTGYLDRLLPLVRPGGLIVAHNVASHRRGIAAYLKALAGRPGLETLLLQMDGPGLGVTLKKR
jgi:caffeoyl-CoA O-methyltransferase